MRIHAIESYYEDCEKSMKCDVLSDFAIRMKVFRNAKCGAEFRCVIEVATVIRNNWRHMQFAQLHWSTMNLYSIEWGDDANSATKRLFFVAIDSVICLL